VTAINANHCPGSVMLLFEGSFGTVLHTGDFRYHSEMLKHPALTSLTALKKKIDRIYLDNTFLDRSCGADVLLLEDEAVDDIINIINQHPPDTVVVIAIDQVGKEELLCVLARRIDTRIWLPPHRWRTLTMLDLTPEQLQWYTQDAQETRFHMCSRRDMTLENVAYWSKLYGRRAIGIRPSGYAATDKSDSRVSDSNIYRVKYSSHSSRQELLEFLDILRPTRVTATSVTTQLAISELHATMVMLYGPNILAAEADLIVQPSGSTKSRKRIHEHYASQRESDVSISIPIPFPIPMKKKTKLCIVPPLTLTLKTLQNLQAKQVDDNDDNDDVSTALPRDSTGVVTMDVVVHVVDAVQAARDVEENEGTKLPPVHVYGKDSLWWKLSGDVEAVKRVLEGNENQRHHLWTKTEDRVLRIIYSNQEQQQNISTTNNRKRCKKTKRMRVLLNVEEEQCQLRWIFLQRHHGTEYSNT
jgi:hypothetical protein